MPADGGEHVQFAQIGEGEQLALHVGRLNHGLEALRRARRRAVVLAETPRPYCVHGGVENARGLAGGISWGIENGCSLVAGVSHARMVARDEFKGKPYA